MILQIEGVGTAARALAEKVRSTYLDASKKYVSVLQIIKSIDKAIEWDRIDTLIIRKMIEQLHEQLVIDESTLDSVPSVKYRLHEVEFGEIGLTGGRRKAEVAMLGATEWLASTLKIKSIWQLQSWSTSNIFDFLGSADMISLI